jgi:uncharacterized protein involved in response to NO
MSKFALFNLGFRPFFLGAGIFAVLSMLCWMLIYIFNVQSSLTTLTPVSWHAHEMIFGYGMAVIAGFLLTAVKNWTSRQTLNGNLLLLLFLTWVAVRILPFTESILAFEMMALMDCLFMASLIIAITYPIVKAKLWIHLAIVSKITLLFLCNILYYLGVLNIVQEGERWGLYAGFYIILSLVIMMGRRLIPFFIERGVDHPIKILNWKWLDISSLILFAAFCIEEVFFYDGIVSTVLSGLLFVLYSMRMIGWYTAEVWKQPLLWVLYLGYGWVVAGFGLKASQLLFNTSPYLSIHAFAVGGVAMMTVGMMARVSLGHTGREVLKPPSALFWVFAFLFLTAVNRVIFPLLDPNHYFLWIALSQILWIISFSLFLLLYLPMLVSPRVDGKPG